MSDPVSAPLPARPVPRAVSPERRAALEQAARDFEASFLAEMLKAAGLGKPRESFGGGAGEDAFASLLVREQARLMAEAGGIGLAEHILNALIAREGLAAEETGDA
ncbi:MAG: flagellar biosynthesis protein FlgJ [Alphaproteobacteria bacterium]|nr:MAG: flagellar biosynthesis protein FlgJ [Alphaproteobacteria bacterium]